VRGAVLALALVAAASGGLEAQQRAAAGEEYQVSILTAGPGAKVWEKWGHNMIRVRNVRTGAEAVYNWGMFSLSQEGYVLHFLMGRMNYWMQPQGMSATYRTYRRDDRTLIEQELALTPEARVELVTFLEWNAREENRFYRYDYYLDNCSTRLRDALDQALGGALRRATQGVDAGTTFRTETRRLSADDLLIYTGLMLGLGPSTDRPIDRWDEMFLPGKVAERLRELRVTHADGSSGPLVVREDTLYASRRFPEPLPAPRKTAIYLVLGTVVGVLLVLAGRAKGRMPFLAGGGLVALLVGLGGALMVFLMSFTDHSVTYGNENAFLVSFIALLLAAALRPALYGNPRARRLAAGLAVAIAGIATCAVLIKVTPWARQDDWELIALLLPIDLGLAAGTLLAVRRTS